MSRLSIIAAFFALVFIAGHSALAQSGYDLFQKGLVKERVPGDLDEAIRLYKQIVEQHKDDRALAAKALIQMGRCYEKLGRAEARKAYERVVKEFADQNEAVSAAQTRLAALGRQEGEEGPILRRVYSGYVGYPGNLSHDGKLATITDWDTGDLAVRDLTSGEVRRLTNKGPWSESNAFADQSMFSPDDKQIAHVWYTHENEAQLRIISTDGTGQRILYPRDEESKKDGAFLWPIDWSPDAERILCTWHKKGYENRVTLLSVGDGSLRELELPDREEGKPISDFSSAKFSPDGRYLTIDRRTAKDARRDIFLLSLEDGSRTPLVEHPADDYLLGWSPDGNCLVFASDRTGAPGIWVLRVDQGKPVGNPKLVKTQMGGFGRVGMMRDGAYYFTTGSGERRNVFTAGFDPETGKVTTAPKALLPDAELYRSMADWLPGADQIAYLEWSDEGRIKIRKIMVHSLTTGATREIVTKPKIKGFNFNSLAVCPTGHWLAVWGYIEDGLKWAVLLIDIETNELTEVKHGNFVNVRWSNDGRWLYFSGFLPDENRSALFRRDMQTGEVTELFEPPSGFFSWTISPDGKQIAYSDSQTGEIKVIPVTGGEPRVVAKVQNMTKVQRAGSTVWTPDGRYLVYIHRERLWRVALEGGEPEAISPGMPGIRHLQIHPDGQRILFSGQRHPSKYELWALENFLPKPEKASGMVVRQVWAGAGDPYFMGAPSPNGKYLSYVDWTTGDLAVRDLATGTNRNLTSEGWEKGWAQHSVFSPDSKQLAYYWWNNEKGEAGGADLRIVGLDGSGPRVVPLDEGTYLRMPAPWSADGKQILALGSGHKSVQILLIPVVDGKMRVLKTLPLHPWLWRYPSIRRKVGMSLSPDGRYVAYTYPAKQDSPECDIFLLATDGSGETALVEHPADDFVLGWAPDGKRVVFVSDRAGSMGIWGIEVADGKPHGTPHLLKPDIGLFHPMGFTPNGSYYYGVASGGNNIYVATYDPQKGNITGEPVLAIKQYEGSNWAPDWSPDGRYLACVSERPGAGRVFLIQAVETGEVRELSPDLEEFDVHSLRWSPDGRSLLGTGRTKDFPPRSMGGILRIDVETGKVGTIAQGGQFPNVTSDGKTMFDVSRGHNGWWIWHYDLTTGDKYPVFRAKVGEHGVGAILGLALSPDGKQLAFQDLDAGMLKVISVAGGQPRELAKVEGWITFAWTPDGKHVLYARQMGKSPSQLWRIGAEGGEPQKLDLTMPLEHIRFHPDGRRIAFTGKAGTDKIEVWVMENFLPQDVGK